jgi:hypothetical protein
MPLDTASAKKIPISHITKVSCKTLRFANRGSLGEEDRNGCPVLSDIIKVSLRENTTLLLIYSVRG